VPTKSQFLDEHVIAAENAHYHWPDSSKEAVLLRRALNTVSAVNKTPPQPAFY
jgi:hypothetical protein